MLVVEGVVTPIETDLIDRLISLLLVIIIARVILGLPSLIAGFWLNRAVHVGATNECESTGGCAMIRFVGPLIRQTDRASRADDVRWNEKIIDARALIAVPIVPSPNLRLWLFRSDCLWNV